MLLILPDAPYDVDVVTPLLYGKVPDQPVWQGGLYLDLMLPSPRPVAPTPAVLYLHAGGWRTGDRSYGVYPWHGPLLAAHGFVVASASYRFTDVAPFPAQLHDAKAAVRWLRANAGTYGVDPGRIGAWGDSAGGHLAALLATTGARPDLEGPNGHAAFSSAVQAAVARCAPTDFRKASQDGPAEIVDALFGGPPSHTAELRSLASPLVHADAGSAPMLLVHGERDEVVPLEQARAMADRLRACGVDVSLHVVEGGFHNLLPDIDPPWGSTPWTELGHDVLAFFRRHLC